MENNVSWLTRLYFKHIFSNNYTHILTTSKFLVPIMKESFGVTEDKIKVWGQPRNDALFREIDPKTIFESIFVDLPPFKKAICTPPLSG